MLTTRLFVYGTLRPGERLHSWILPAILDEKRGTTPGRLYGLAGRPNFSFPVADLTATDGIVQGDVYEVDLGNHVVHEVIEMERNAGYVVRTVQVTLEDGTVVDALAFHEPSSKWYGPRIPNDDWYESDRSQTYDTRFFEHFAVAE